MECVYRLYIESSVSANWNFREVAYTKCVSFIQPALCACLVLMFVYGRPILYVDLRIRLQVCLLPLA